VVATRSGGGIVVQPAPGAGVLQAVENSLWQLFSLGLHRCQTRRSSQAINNAPGCGGNSFGGGENPFAGGGNLNGSGETHLRWWPT